MEVIKKRDRITVNYTKERSDVDKLLKALADGKCYGVKGGTVYKIIKFAKEMGLA